MVKLNDHPTVKAVRAKQANGSALTPPTHLNAHSIRQKMLELGADDVGFVQIDRPELDDQREEILTIFPRTRSLIAYICKMNREPVRSAVRSVSNLEFHTTGHHVDDVGRAIVSHLESQGIAAVNPAMAFPMEVKRFPDEKPWMISHKPIAVAAGLGQMGIHRNVIHPKFGNFILLGTILVNAEISEYQTQIDYNPCFECKLCVAACPVGAIGSDGWFDFNACYTHNYREFLGGFSDWVDNISDSPNAKSYRDKVSDGETVSMWQSLSFGPNYNAAYCMSVCPAGEDVIGSYLNDKRNHLDTVVKPLQQKEETIFAVEGSDAASYTAKRYPHKTIKFVGNGIRSGSIDGFLRNLPHFFQRNQSEGLNAVYHFIFTGLQENATHEATITIRDKTIQVQDGLQGESDIRITADASTWVQFVNHDVHIVWALLRRKIKIKGSPRLLIRFGECFPL